jgi:hypothetical protein
MKMMLGLAGWAKVAAAKRMKSRTERSRMPGADQNVAFDSISGSNMGSPEAKIVPAHVRRAFLQSETGDVLDFHWPPPGIGEMSRFMPYSTRIQKRSLA